MIILTWFCSFAGIVCLIHVRNGCVLSCDERVEGESSGGVQYASLSGQDPEEGTDYSALPKRPRHAVQAQ